MRTNRLIIVLCLLLSVVNVSAWDWWPLPMAEPDNEKDSLLYVSQLSVLTSTGSTAPTLLQAHRNGEIASAAHSGNLSIGIVKPATRPHRWYDYDGAVVLTGRLQADKSIGTGYFSQLYAHLRLYIFDITVGIKPRYWGCAEEGLTSGSLLFSNNAHPIPMVSVGIDRWTAFPGLFGFLEVKGGFTHGWLHDNNPYVSHTLLHHKYAGARIGGRLPVNISYEFHHAAQWGGTSATLGDLGSGWSDFTRIVRAEQGGVSRNEQLNAEGNHIGWQQLCLTAKGKLWHINLYWQVMQEDSPIRFMWRTMSPADGLWGIYVHQDAWRFISSLTMEYLHTADQSGPWHDKDGFTYGGRDSYYYNSVYRQGWTYFSRTIGHPALTPTNNRVQSCYIGLRGDIYGFLYTVAAQHTHNRGDYVTPIDTRNTSMMIEVNKHVDKAWGLDFGLSLGVDWGTQYGTQFGALITIRKQGLIKSF